MEKINLTTEKTVNGNFMLHKQSYQYQLLPADINLPPKLILGIKTDVFNSLRFMQHNQFMEFLEDSLISFLNFKEANVSPQYRQAFRISNLDEALQRLRNKCIAEWKKERQPQLMEVIH